jgi:hypothetical protein
MAFVDQLTRVLATAFCANEYLHFDIKGWNPWLRAFEKQHAVAKFAVVGWQRLNEVAHMLPPFDRRRKNAGGGQKVPSPAIWRKVRRIELAWPQHNVFI